MTMQMPTAIAPKNPTPEFSYPRIVLMAIDPVDGGAPVSFGVGNPHPYVASMRVIAMYIRHSVGGVEIYSFDGAKGGVRDLVPMQRVRLIREEMPVDIFNDEINHAEAGYPEDDEPDDLEPPDPEPVSSPANGT